MQKYHLQNRPEREITAEPDIKEILKRGKFTVISTCRENEPYIVTLSYGFDAERNCLYMHCGTKGLKLDFFNSNSRVCATIIEDGGYVADECAHIYKSVVFWGDICSVTELEEKKHGMKILLNHLENNLEVIQEKLLKLENHYSNMQVLRIDITQIHAKAGK